MADEKQDGMDLPARPEVYVPLARNSQNPLTFVVRSAAAVESTLASAREQLRSVDKDLVVTDVAAMTDVVRESMSEERFRATLLSLFAGVALFLAALGIYGVLAYFVSQRSRELGIRVALGARPAAIFGLVVGQGLRAVAIGAAAGIAASLGITRAMQSLLFEIAPLDAPTYSVAMAMLTTIAIGACALPAMRATRVDPLVALREE